MSEFDVSAVDLSGILNANNEQKAKQLPDPKTYHILTVVPEAMEFAWEAAGRGTLLEGASLVLKDIPLIVRCRNCQKTFQPDEFFDPCPDCGDVNPEIISGKELRVVAIEVKDK